MKYFLFAVAAIVVCVFWPFPCGCWPLVPPVKVYETESGIFYYLNVENVSGSEQHISGDLGNGRLAPNEKQTCPFIDLGLGLGRTDWACVEVDGYLLSIYVKVEKGRIKYSFYAP